MIGSMFVGLLIGLLAGAITNRGERMGCFGKMFLGWIGAFLGQMLFGTWGPILADTAIIPSVLGAMILLAIFWKKDSQFNLLEQIKRLEIFQPLFYELQKKTDMRLAWLSVTVPFYIASSMVQ